MKTIKVGAGDAELSLGGETVLFRHEKTFVSRTRYAMSLCTCMDDETVAQKLEDIKKVDYERIGERMFVEMVYVNYSADGKQDYVELVKKAAETGRILILDCKDAEIAKAALEVMQRWKTDPEWCRCFQLRSNERCCHSSRCCTWRKRSRSV